MKEITAFLTFDGNCRQAMEFYRECFRGNLFVLPFSEAPGGSPAWAGETKDRIMHATLSDGFTLLMASLAEIERLFAALGEGGEVTMPLQDTFWGARFGTLTDRFGVRWMLNFAHPPDESSASTG